MSSFGEKLRQERESRDASVDDIANATKIHRRYLEALERDEFETLPGAAYGKFYIRAYADTLGFDPDPLIAEYDRELHRRERDEPLEPSEQPAPEEPEAAPERAPEPEPEPEPVEESLVAETPATPEVEAGPRRIALGPVLLAIGALVVVVWFYFAFFHSPEPAHEPEPEPEPVQEPAVQEPPPEETEEQAPVQEPAADPVVETTPPPGRLTVTEYGVGKRIVNQVLEGRGEPIEEGQAAWFQTRVRGGRVGEKIRHVWIHEGKTIQTIELKLGSEHWRTHSRKTLWQQGEWTVEARDGRGNVLASETFRCVRVRR